MELPLLPYNSWWLGWLMRREFYYQENFSVGFWISFLMFVLTCSAYVRYYFDEDNHHSESWRLKGRKRAARLIWLSVASFVVIPVLGSGYVFTAIMVATEICFVLAVVWVLFKSVPVIGRLVKTLWRDALGRS